MVCQDKHPLLETEIVKTSQGTYASSQKNNLTCHLPMNNKKQERNKKETRNSFFASDLLDLRFILILIM